MYITILYYLNLINDRSNLLQIIWNKLLQSIQKDCIYCAETIITNTVYKLNSKFNQVFHIV